VYNILAGYYMRQRFPIGQLISCFDVRGEVSAVGGVGTVVRTGDGHVVIPNSALIELVVHALRAPEPPAAPKGGELCKLG
jgi:hypothetical protein